MRNVGNRITNHLSGPFAGCAAFLNLEPTSCPYFFPIFFPKSSPIQTNFFSLCDSQACIVMAAMQDCRLANLAALSNAKTAALTAKLLLQPENTRRLYKKPQRDWHVSFNMIGAITLLIC
jgi:hypothetical protein